MWHHRPAQEPAHSPELLAVVDTATSRETLAELAVSCNLKLTLSAALQGAMTQGAAVVILDRDLAGHDWREAIRSFARSRSAPCVILASTVMDDPLFEEVVKQGGFDVVAKPLRADELRSSVQLAIKYWRSRAPAGVNG